MPLSQTLNIPVTCKIRSVKVLCFFGISLQDNLTTVTHTNGQSLSFSPRNYWNYMCFLATMRRRVNSIERASICRFKLGIENRNVGLGYLLSGRALFFELLGSSCWRDFSLMTRKKFSKKRSEYFPLFLSLALLRGFGTLGVSWRVVAH